MRKTAIILIVLAVFMFLIAGGFNTATEHETLMTLQQIQGVSDLKEALSAPFTKGVFQGASVTVLTFGFIFLCWSFFRK